MSSLDRRCSRHKLRRPRCPNSASARVIAITGDDVKTNDLGGIKTNHGGGVGVGVSEGAPRVSIGAGNQAELSRSHQRAGPDGVLLCPHAGVSYPAEEKPQLRESQCLYLRAGHCRRRLGMDRRSGDAARRLALLRRTILPERCSDQLQRRQYLYASLRRRLQSEPNARASTGGSLGIGWSLPPRSLQVFQDERIRRRQQCRTELPLPRLRIVLPEEKAMVTFALMIISYWLPTLLAFHWWHRNRMAILIVNCLFGWTIVGL